MNLSGIWNTLTDAVRSEQTNAASPASANTAQAAAQMAVPNGGKTDQADLSSSGLAAAQSSTSDVRMDKVQSVGTAIQAGTYQVSAGDVADKVMQNLLG